MANPLYGLLLAYTNDYLDPEDMASASARLLFVNGLGAIGGPLVMGWLMGRVGPAGFYIFLGAIMTALAVYALWRITQRATIEGVETGAFVAVAQAATTPVTIGNVVEEWEEQAAAEEEAAPDNV